MRWDLGELFKLRWFKPSIQYVQVVALFRQSVQLQFSDRTHNWHISNTFLSLLQHLTQNLGKIKTSVRRIFRQFTSNYHQGFQAFGNQARTLGLWTPLTVEYSVVSP